MKKLLAFLLATLMILSFTACRSEEEIAKGENWKKLGIEAMEEHLKNKYDIDVTLETIIIEDENSIGAPVANPVADYIPLVTANFTVNGEKYNICADLSDEDNVKCYDNYQSKELQQMMKDYLYGFFEGKVTDVNIEITDNFNNCSYAEDRFNYNDINNAELIHEKYENVEEIFKNHQKNKDDKEYTNVRIQLCYYDGDPITIENKDIENLKKTELTQIIKHTGLITGNNRYNLYVEEYYLPVIEEYLYTGHYVSKHYEENPEILTYNKNELVKVGDFMFYGENLDVEQVDAELGNNVLSIAIKNGKYECYIPTTAIKTYSEDLSYVLLFVDTDGNLEEKTTTAYILPSYSLIKGDEFSYFAVTLDSHDYEEYDYWCIIEMSEE